MFQERKIALVSNPTSGKAIAIAGNISLLLSGMDIRHSVFTSEWPQSWEGFSEVWIVGGDGTLNFFINQYPQIQLPLSIFAGGTGNDFHWMLYGQTTLEQQVENMLEAKPFMTDAGTCNGELFLNGIGIGFDGAIVKDLVGKKKFPGKTSYLISILKNISGYREKNIELKMPGEVIKQDCFMISVANAARYGGGFKVAPRALLTDGLLDINIVGAISLWKRLRYIPVIEKGEHLGLPFIQYRHARQVIIRALNSLPAHRDGEYFEAKEFDIHLLPKRFSFLLYGASGNK